MSRVSDTRLRTRETAARLVASGRPAHEITVDLIYAEIRQGSRTTINDELKLWKDEQARNDALSAALPPAVADAMLSLWALAVAQGEQVFARRSEEIEMEAATATTQIVALETANAALQAEIRSLRVHADEQQSRLAAVMTDLAQAQSARDAALRQAEAAIANRDAENARSEQTVRETSLTHTRELEALRLERTEHEAALRAEVNQATSRLEAVQKHVMLQTEDAREAQRRAESALSDIRKRNELLVAEVERTSADAAEQRRLAERHEKLLDRVTDEAQQLRLGRDALAQQMALLQGQMRASGKSLPSRRNRFSR
ncbi:Plasmid replication region DNA-binding N-term (plasmid) [Paraburkholderia caribensis MBA4]|uniref:Plasmid replication region DNA-binding N-term n=1 Tax=Paraburkholderia caribensis MBA4 TaxID=1323664 RepID=A0A0P0RN60_9BURK|nr:DNA-binding protein [Paraburkholderia caribensis]ALL70288.1 Plasmid replication region DNA-binding N-term [Paraburkholderia caribensis MBA4]